MATKAVTLKNTNDDTVYPVTDISLVNGGIFADTIAPVEAGEQVETAMIADGAITGDKIATGAVTAAKLAGKAKIALNKRSANTDVGRFSATDRGILIVDELFQTYTSNADDSAQISFSGASGKTVTPKATQRGGINYVRNHAFGLALVDAGDSVSWTVTYTNAGVISNGGFVLFIPCNW